MPTVWRSAARQSRVRLKRVGQPIIIENSIKESHRENRSVHTVLKDSHHLIPKDILPVGCGGGIVKNRCYYAAWTGGITQYTWVAREEHDPGQNEPARDRLARSPSAVPPPIQMLAIALRPHQAVQSQGAFPTGTAEISANAPPLAHRQTARRNDDDIPFCSSCADRHGRSGRGA